MQNNFPKLPLFLSLSFLALSCLAFFYFNKAIADNNKKFESARAEWAAETSRRAEIVRFNAAIKTIDPKRIELESHFAKSSDPVPFLDAIEGLAPLAGVKTEVTSVDIAKDHNGLLVGVKMSGSFKGIYKFITLLENSPYELIFTSVDVAKTAAPGAASSGADGPGWQGILQIKLLSFIE